MLILKALIDVDEVYTIETWMTGNPLKKYQKKILKKREEKRQEREFSTTNRPLNTASKQIVGKEKRVEDYLKKLTQSLKENSTIPTIAVAETAIQEKNDTEIATGTPKIDDAEIEKLDDKDDIQAKQQTDDKDISFSEKQTNKLQEDCPFNEKDKNSKTVEKNQDIWSILTKIDFQSLQQSVNNPVADPRKKNLKDDALSKPLAHHEQPNLKDSKGRFHKIPLIVEIQPYSASKLDPSNPDPRLRPRVKKDTLRMAHAKDAARKHLKKEDRIRTFDLHSKANKKPLHLQGTLNLLGSKDKTLVETSQTLSEIYKTPISLKNILEKPLPMVIDVNESKPIVDFNEKAYLEKPLPMEMDLPISHGDNKPALDKQDISKPIIQIGLIHPFLTETQKKVNTESKKTDVQKKQEIHDVKDNSITSSLTSTTTTIKNKSSHQQDSRFKNIKDDDNKQNDMISHENTLKMQISDNNCKNVKNELVVEKTESETIENRKLNAKIFNNSEKLGPKEQDTKLENLQNLPTISQLKDVEDIQTKTEIQAEAERSDQTNENSSNLEHLVVTKGNPTINQSDKTQHLKDNINKKQEIEKYIVQDISTDVDKALLNQVESKNENVGRTTKDDNSMKCVDGSGGVSESIKNKIKTGMYINEISTFVGQLFVQL